MQLTHTNKIPPKKVIQESKTARTSRTALDVPSTPLHPFVLKKSKLCSKMCIRDVLQDQLSDTSMNIFIVRLAMLEIPHQLEMRTIHCI